MEKKPTIRDVKKILNDKSISGYNDKRKNGGRIKLHRPISHAKQAVLESKLGALFPNYKITCSDWEWVSRGWTGGCDITTTVIHFRHN